MDGADDAREDHALVVRIASGDAAAEAALSSRLLPRIRAYGLRHLRDRAAAADLAQHVVVVVIEAIRDGRVTEPARLAAFVSGTCRNTVLDWAKTERRRRAILDRHGAELGGSVEANGIAGIDARTLSSCLDRLAERARAILVMTYYADLDCDAIARELGMAAGTVRVARHRALAQLHDCVTGGLA